MLSLSEQTVHRESHYDYMLVRGIAKVKFRSVAGYAKLQTLLSLMKCSLRLLLDIFSELLSKWRLLDHTMNDQSISDSK